MPPVKLYVYDLTHGMAQQLGPALLGRPLEGIWHTGIVAFGSEFFFSGDGINRMPPGQTPFGSPYRVVDLGETEIPQSLFETYLSEIAPAYGPGTYHLLDHNCNNFTDSAAQFLVGRGIPSDITSLPTELINTPIGQMIRPMIEQMYGPSALTRAEPTSAPIAPFVPMANTTKVSTGIVNEVSSIETINSLISSGQALVIDFTSPQCGPCVAIAPIYAQLASNIPEVTFVSVNTLHSPMVARQFGVNATPTFSLYHEGKKINEIRGANRSALENALFDLANTAKQGSTFKTNGHPHYNLPLPLLQSRAPALFNIGNVAAVIKKLKQFLNDNGDPRAEAEPWPLLEATLTAALKASNGGEQQNKIDQATLATVTTLLESLILRVKEAQLFPVLDIWRIAVLHPAITIHYTKLSPAIIRDLLEKTVGNSASPSIPSVSQMMALRLACNMFATSEGREFMNTIAGQTAVVIVVKGLLGNDTSIRENAAALAYNLSLVLPKDDSDPVIEVVSAVQHALLSEKSPEGVFRLLSALGHFAFANDAIVDFLKGLEFSMQLSTISKSEVSLPKTKDLIAELQRIF